MNWTPTDTGQLLLLAMAIFGAYCIVRGMRISSRLKKEQGL
ncbi:hypothetical protein M2396_002724 [Pseudomonas sp. BIGb0278]|nr:hypothetical protein [Pseudomonas sp. BIGb0278]MCS4284428.1 hypothetical protein [Pseudomonas sp. BIGb0278]